MTLRLALLSDTFPPDVGGLAISAARLAHGLTACGHTVEVFAPTPSLRPGEMRRTVDGSLHIWRIGAQRKPDETLTDWFDLLVARHTEQPFDLFQAYFVTRAGFVAVYAGRSLGVPSVISARGNDLDRAVFDPAKAAHIRYALEHAHAVTANTRQMVARAAALAPGRQVALIPNGVDSTMFTPGPRDPALAEALGLGTLPVLGFVGEARAKKGLGTLLLAFRALATRRPAALWLLGGARPGADRELLELFQRQNPKLTVVVTPYLDHEQMPAYYRQIDVLLMPSQRDGLPNALLEGMATGRAIIGSRAGGIPDALHHEQNGLLVLPNAVEDLVTAAERLLDNADLRTQLGAAARATALHNFSPTTEIEANLAIYRTLGVPVAS
ncbi:MAG: glycosyltransferase family 4 protein [Oscillochloris sp.]|nr:glycosyltransferase family 4 protein [Oscillochloris sp.]